MATAQKKSTGGKRTASSSGKRTGTSGKSASAGRKKAASQPKPIRREVGAAVCFLLAIFAAFGYFNVHAIFIDFFCGIAKGMIGYGFWLVPPMLLVSSVGQIARMIAGDSKTSMLEIILGLVIMLVCLAYMAYVMLTRCETAVQRILLPVVACLIGFGFCWEPSSFTCPWRAAGRQKAQPFPLSCMTTMKTGLSCSTPAVTTPPITARKPDSRCCSMNRIWRTGCPTAGAGDKHPLYG